MRKRERDAEAAPRSARADIAAAAQTLRRNAAKRARGCRCSRTHVPSMMMCLSGFWAQSMRRLSSPMSASVGRSASAISACVFGRTVVREPGECAQALTSLGAASG